MRSYSPKHVNIPTRRYHIRTMIMKKGVYFCRKITFSRFDFLMLGNLNFLCQKCKVLKRYTRCLTHPYSPSNSMHCLPLQVLSSVTLLALPPPLHEMHHHKIELQQTWIQYTAFGIGSGTGKTEWTNISHRTRLHSSIHSCIAKLLHNHFDPISTKCNEALHLSSLDREKLPKMGLGVACDTGIHQISETAGVAFWIWLGWVGWVFIVY